MTCDENRTCFMAVANRPYQKYVPWFLYFLNRAYPKAYKLILLDGRIVDDVRQMLGLIHGNYEIRECAFPEYISTNATEIKCLRWLFYEPFFEQYDCMSIGDIDLAIYKESPSYMEQHLKHCEQLRIPYSNFIRPANAGPRRVCGIHVIKPREWFAIMNPIIEKYRSRLAHGDICLPEHGFNEQLLLKMIIESELGEPPYNLSETYWSSLVTSNHHGTHIRLAEHGGIKGLQSARRYQYHKKEIIASTQTHLFQRLVEMSPYIGHILRSIAKTYEKF